VAIVNPAAGGNPHGLLDELLGATPKSVQVDVEWTRGSGDAEQIAAERSYSPSTVVVAIGGDGTVREVASGIHRGRANPALVVAPGGTGNSSYGLRSYTPYTTAPYTSDRSIWPRSRRWIASCCWAPARE
jgi:diacylglycerol kinase (ATP)